MKILLHTCCAPCMIYPLKKLRQDGNAVSGYFYNPNIHPFGEYLKRKEAVEAVSQSLGVEMSYPEYLPSEFFQEINLQEKRPERCSICWTMRLKAAARVAHSAGFEAFTTTLLVSPYQDQELIRKIGAAAGDIEGVKFFYEDFRPGFRLAHEEARGMGIYCQKYCGCLYSEIERCRKSEKH